MLHRGCSVPSCLTCAAARITVPRTCAENRGTQLWNAFNEKVTGDDFEAKTSALGNNFGLVLKCTGTGWTELYPSKTKCAAAHNRALERWEASNGRFSHTTPPKETVWRVDNGVNVGKRVKQGVEAYAKRKAGGAEKSVRDVSDVTRVLLHDAAKRWRKADFPWMAQRGPAAVWCLASKYASFLANFCPFRKGESARRRRGLGALRGKTLMPFLQPVIFKWPEARRRRREKFERRTYSCRGAFVGFSNFTGEGGSYVVLIAGESGPKLIKTTTCAAVAN
jgi:hypothetical protein